MTQGFADSNLDHEDAVLAQQEADIARRREQIRLKKASQQLPQHSNVPIPNPNPDLNPNPNPAQLSFSSHTTHPAFLSVPLAPATHDGQPGPMLPNGGYMAAHLGPQPTPVGQHYTL